MIGPHIYSVKNLSDKLIITPIQWAIDYMIEQEALGLSSLNI